MMTICALGRLGGVGRRAPSHLDSFLGFDLRSLLRRMHRCTGDAWGIWQLALELRSNGDRRRIRFCWSGGIPRFAVWLGLSGRIVCRRLALPNGGVVLITPGSRLGRRIGYRWRRQFWLALGLVAGVFFLRLFSLPHQMVAGLSEGPSALHITPAKKSPASITGQAFCGEM